MTINASSSSSATAVGVGVGVSVGVVLILLVIGGVWYYRKSQRPLAGKQYRRDSGGDEERRGSTGTGPLTPVKPMSGGAVRFHVPISADEPAEPAETGADDEGKSQPELESLRSV